MMNILVTGASGFLGKFLCKRLKELKNDITPLSSKDANLIYQDSLNRFNDIKYDRIFHLAAWTQAGDFCLYHPGEQWLINQQINATVLKWWRDYQPQAKLISIGTSCSYPADGQLVEKNYLMGEPFKDLYAYGMTKRMLLVGQQSFQKQYGLKYLTVIPSTLYGPNYHKGEKQLHFIFDLMRKILEFKYCKKEIVLWGDGKQRREVVYINDFIEAMLELDSFLENDIVNIGTGEDYSIAEFADIICEICGIDPKNVKYDIAKYIGAKSKILNCDKMNKLLPHLKRTPLEEGLKVTIEWMQRHYLNGE